ncbi:MAG: hypothetical protein WKF79_12905 [Nocardioides sp.]
MRTRASSVMQPPGLSNVDLAVAAAAHASSATVPPDPDKVRRHPFVLAAGSYLAIRRAVGVLGLGLPLFLFLAERWLDGSVELRGSLSAYYHSGARDIFVGTLCIVGFLLMRYLFGDRGSVEFWLSAVAGLMCVGVALVPTQRPGASDDADCADVVGVPACSPLQQTLGEGTAEAIHFISAVTFILALGALCFVTAYQLHRRSRELREPLSPTGRWMARFHAACGATIVVGVAWAVGLKVDLAIGDFQSLWVGEVVSVIAFALSWLVSGYDLQRLLGALEQRVP